MIKCKICNEEFKSVITWKHLKKHNITTAEYKEKYGSVVSDDYKEKKRNAMSGSNNPNFGNKHSDHTKKLISEKNKNRVAPNKGQRMTANQKELLSAKAKERNKNWKETNSHPLSGRTHTAETKDKIKEKRKQQVITNEQIQKAIQTKKDNGYDFATFKGKTHTDETKNKISAASKKTAIVKRNKSIQLAASRLNQCGYLLKNVNENILDIECKTCNTVFNRTRQYATPSKLNAEMCPVCYPPTIGFSNAEKELFDFVSMHTVAVGNVRNIIPPYEIDIWVEEKNLAIEFNGLYWHSEIYKDSKYHSNKSKLCNEKGIKLLQVFSDEWELKRDIVKSRILSSLGIFNRRLQARKCIVKEINTKTASDFLSNNHIQGTGRSNIKLGLYFDNELVSVMTFLNSDISKGVKGWELNRFCSVLDTQVIGGAGKLFNYFIKQYNPESITSFADARWSNNDSVYTKIGFVDAGETPPNYWYFITNEGVRYHRYSLRKPNGCKQSERELRESQGYLRIYDCGNKKYIWSK